MTILQLLYFTSINKVVIIVSTKLYDENTIPIDYEEVEQEENIATPLHHNLMRVHEQVPPPINATQRMHLCETSATSEEPHPIIR